MNPPRKAPSFELIHIPGPQGQLECLHLDAIAEMPLGIALVAHPNPLEGGSFNNKVVHTLAKTLSRLGWIVFCPNLRGVGHSQGVHDFGRGEVDDMEAVLSYARTRHPETNRLILAGFSFGCFVQAQLQQRHPPRDIESMILVGPAVSRYAFPTVPANTLVIHGEEDEVVALAAVFDWARPQSLPVLVIPGVGHFFHGKLPQLADTVTRHLS